MEKGIAPGDRVRVELDDGTLEGIVMPASGLSGRGRVVIKLSSGYNIGIDEHRIRSITLTEKYVKPAGSVTQKMSTVADRPVVSILSTGGTIASKVDYRTGGVYASYTAEDILQVAPELHNIASIKSRVVMNVMSEDMHKDLWIEMARAVAEELNSGSDGVVVTHGTDTMHYSTAALSFMLKNLSKPVIFTGSQRSSDRGSSDAFLNIVCSTAFAASDAAGVYLVMHGSMSDSFCLAHIGTKVRKMHTSRRDAFKSVNACPVAKITPDCKVEFLSTVSRRGSGVVSVDDRFEEKVAFIKVYPGMDPKLIDFYINEGYKGIVFEGTALGHVPTTIREKSLIPKIEAARDAGLAMMMTTQCLFGRVHPYVYSNLREVSSRGVVYCEDMLPETAYVKLMWVLGHTNRPSEVKDLMLDNIAGEITKRTVTDVEFIDF